MFLKVVYIIGAGFALSALFLAMPLSYFLKALRIPNVTPSKARIANLDSIIWVVIVLAPLFIILNIFILMFPFVLMAIIFLVYIISLTISIKRYLKPKWGHTILIAFLTSLVNDVLMWVVFFLLNATFYGW